MKHVLFPFYLIIIILSLTNCHSKPKIGFLMDDMILERWEKDRQMFTEKVNELGGTTIVEVADNDPSKQLELAVKMLNQGIDVLVLIPVDLELACQIVKIAKKEGVPVISYDRLVKNCNIDFYISTDDIQIGELQGNYMTKLVPKGNYALLGGPTTDYNAFLLRLGQMNALQPLIEKGDINLVMSDYANSWSTSEGYRLIKTYYSNNTDSLDVIIASNDALATGAIEFLKEKNLQGKVLVAGMDADLVAIKNIVAGFQTITIYKPIESTTLAAASTAMKICRGEPLERFNITVNNGRKLVPSILLPPKIVNSQNIKMTVVSEGFLKESEIFPQ